MATFGENYTEKSAPIRKNPLDSPRDAQYNYIKTKGLVR